MSRPRGNGSLSIWNNTPARFQVCVISKPMLILGASFHLLDLADAPLLETPGDVRISLFLSLKCQLKSYSSHSLFVIPVLSAFQTQELLHMIYFVRNRYNTGYIVDVL